MLRALPYLLLVGAVVAAVFWTARHRATPRALPAADSARAALAYGRDAGDGRLTVTPTQLVFTADSGRVLVLERLDIVGVTATRDLPDRTTAAALLVVTTSEESYYFAVDRAEQWVRLLT